MRGILLITEDLLGTNAIQSALVRESWRVAISGPDEESILKSISDLTPEILIIDCRDNTRQIAATRKFLAECNLKELPVLALLTPEQAVNMEWAGVDEFLTEPFNGSELTARLRLLLWRTSKISNDQVIKIGDLMIDMLNYDVSVDGLPVEMTFKEYELLTFLAIHRGRVFTREALLDHVWGYDYYGGTRTVDVHIRRLRAKLGSSCESLIETVRNVGYRFSS
ncbi:MAG TPA: transcriptional regulator [Armatimonadetes bacterium]|nr:transcriptional regulator [Armatimonadota bacterium]